jgi:hypothetical protein
MTYQGKKKHFGKPGIPTPVALELYGKLTGLHTEKKINSFG